MKIKELRELINAKYTDNGMWYVGIVYVDELNVINTTYAYFSERFEAERWFDTITTNTKAYAGWCCDTYRYINLETLLKED